MSVYFASRDSLIKIGTSRDPHHRTRALDSYLLATAPGSFEEERTLHEWFASDHVYGEWFRPSLALLALIDGLIAEEAARKLGLAPLRTGRKSTIPSERAPRFEFHSKKAKRSDHPHGNYMRYNAGCRCDECRAAMSELKRGKKDWKAKYRATVARLDAAEKAAEAAS